MMHLERSWSRAEVVDSSGNPCVLVTERLSLGAGIGHTMFGGSYVRPVGVEREGAVTAVKDVVMLAKLVGLLAVTLATIVGTVRR